MLLEEKPAKEALEVMHLPPSPQKRCFVFFNDPVHCPVFKTHGE